MKDLLLGEVLLTALHKQKKQQTLDFDLSTLLALKGVVHALVRAAADLDTTGHRAGLHATGDIDRVPPQVEGVLAVSDDTCDCVCVCGWM